MAATRGMVAKLRKSAYPDFIASRLDATCAASETREATWVEALVLQVPRGREAAVQT